MPEEHHVDAEVCASGVTVDLGGDAQWFAEPAELAHLMTDGATWQITEKSGPYTNGDAAVSRSGATADAGEGERGTVTASPLDGDTGPSAEQLTASIVDQARAQALYEADQIRRQAMQEAHEARAARLEEIRAEAQREATWLRERAEAEAEQLKRSIVEQARAQAQYEATQIREQAMAESHELRQQASAGAERVKAQRLEEIRAELEAEAARLRQEMEAKVNEEALRFRGDALTEAEQVKAAITEHARARSSAEASRIVDEAKAEAERLVAEATEAARAKADRIREEANAEAEQLRSELTDALAKLELQAEQHVPLHADEKREDHRGPATLLSSTEIGNREFPTVTRGFDRESVRKWLRLVELSHALLEDELDRARAEWERALEILAATRIYLGRLPRGDGHSLDLPLDRELDRARAEWERSIDTIASSRPARTESSFRTLLLKKAHVEEVVGHQLFGYSRSQVRELLEASATQTARLESQIANLRAENEELRSRMLQQVLEATPHFITIPERREASWDDRGLLGSGDVSYAAPAVEPPNLDAAGLGKDASLWSEADDWTPYPAPQPSETS